MKLMIDYLHCKITKGDVKMKIADGVEMLDLPVNRGVGSGIVHPTLIWEEGEVILVDTGFPGQVPEIRKEMERVGIPFDKLTKVLITHHDIDHIGGLPGILKELSGRVEVVSHEVEKPYIQGDKIPHKLAALESNKALLPADMKVKYEMLKAGFANSKSNVDRVVRDGDELACGGGIKIIYTPGHTMGHMVLYLKRHKLLIAGDTLFAGEGQLGTPPPGINFDNDLAKESLAKLTGYDVEAVICYHGGLFKDDVNGRIRMLAI